MSTYRLNSLVTLALVGLVVFLQLANAQSDIYQYEKRQTSAKYCGQKLSNTLQLICHGSYNSMFKKNGQEMEMDDYPLDDSYPFRSRAKATAIIRGRFGGFGGGRFRRDTRGVYDECCLKSCSIQEMRSYCADPL